MHEEDTHADGRRFVQGANVALATTRMSHLANKNGSSATAVFDGSMSSKMLCYGDLVTLGIDGVGYLAPREHMSCKQQDDGPVSLLCAPCDGNGPGSGLPDALCTACGVRWSWCGCHRVWPMRDIWLGRWHSTAARAERRAAAADQPQLL